MVVGAVKEHKTFRDMQNASSPKVTTRFYVDQICCLSTCFYRTKGINGNDVPIKLVSA